MKPTLMIMLMLLMALLLASCTIKATIEGPTGLIYTYRGPKDVDLSIKTGDLEVTYSGKSKPWWHGLMPLLMKTVPDITVVK